MKISSVKLSMCLVLVNILHLKFCESVAIEKDLTLTWEQKLILDEFKLKAIQYVPHEYMKKDIFLIRWLRAQDFNLQRAEKMLMKNLKWREDKKIDTILQEDFSDVEENFHYAIDAEDIEGKPVAYFNLGLADFRSYAVAGKLDRYLRYMDKYLEDITSRVRKLQEEGKNVTQYDFIANLKGTNIVQHGITGYTRFIFSYEENYPGAADKMFFINSPIALLPVLNAIESAMSPLTRQALEFYGTNKEEWQSKIFKIIPRDQLPLEIGGTKVYDFDYLDR